jgi:hypothetical protein
MPNLTISTIQPKFTLTVDETTVVLNQSQVPITLATSGVTNAIWGTIAGTLSNQTDLQTALNSKQDTLVSGTNIKTINSTSLLGSGNISLSANPSGSTGQIQFNNSGSFGADSGLVWDNTAKSLSVSRASGTGVYNALNFTGASTGNQAVTLNMTNTNANGRTAIIAYNDVNHAAGYEVTGTNVAGLNLDDSVVLFGANTRRFVFMPDGSVSSTGVSPVIFRMGGYDIGQDKIIFTSSGLAGFGQLTPTSQLHVQSQLASRVALITQGIASQTANLSEWQNNSGTILNRVLADGTFGNGYGSAGIKPILIPSGGNTGQGGHAFVNYFGATTGYIVPDNAGNMVFANALGNTVFTIISASTKIDFQAISIGTAGYPYSPSVALDTTNGSEVGFYLPSGYGSNTLSIVTARTPRMTFGATGNVLVSGFTASTVGLTIKAAASQTANIQEWQNSSSTVLSAVKADGSYQPASLADASATNNSVYYSTTLSKLVYKDTAGTVNALY